MIKRIFIVSGVIIVVALFSLSGIIYLYREQIIQGFVKEANKYINTPVNVEKISLDFFHNFPRVSLRFQDVTIRESYPESVKTLAEAEEVFCTFSLLELIKGNYTLRQVQLENAKVGLKINEKGIPNYDFLKENTQQPDQSPKGQKTFSFEISKVILKNVQVFYLNIPEDQHHSVLAQEINANFNYQNESYQTRLKGDLLCNSIGIGDHLYFENKNIHLDGNLTYFNNDGLVNFKKVSLGINEGQFICKGGINTSSSNLIDLQVTGKNTNMQTLLTLLPKEYSTYFSDYKSRGNIYFNGAIKRAPSGASPSINVNFGANNATFTHPEMKEAIQKLQFKGNFNNGNQNNLKTTELSIKNIKGTLKDKPLSGNLLIRNFNDHYIRFNADLVLDVNAALPFIPKKSLMEGSGTLDADVNFAGKLAHLKDPRQNLNVRASGDVTLKDLTLKTSSSKLPFRKFNGNFIFNNEDLAISDLSGYVGNSHILLNGLLTNVFSFLLLKNQPIGIEADLHSEFLDLDELLSGNLSTARKTDTRLPRRRIREQEIMNDLWKKTSNKQEYSFSIYPKLRLNFNCNVERLKFRRFKGQHISGNLEIKNQQAQLNNMSFQAANGNIKLDGSLNAMQKNRIQIQANADLDGIAIDSIFYIFGNFNQEFLVADHLNGNLHAKVNTKMFLDSTLSLYTNSLVADASTTVKHGELNHFEPLYKLSNFIDEERLANVKFSELKNDFRIANRTIYIPEMEIRTNVSNIKIQGTHTFDQEIHYKVQVPLRELSPKLKAMQQKAEARSTSFGAIQDDGSGRTQLFLSLDGTTDDYKITYDNETVKEKIKADIKKEGQELKEAFRNKGRDTSRQKQLNEEEFFDF